MKRLLLAGACLLALGASAHAEISYDDIQACQPTGTRPGDLRYVGRSSGALMQCWQAHAQQRAIAFQRQMAEQAKQQEEQRKRDAEQAAQQAAYDATPEGRVYKGYKLYAIVRLCHDVRDGYAVQYINDFELDRAQTVIKNIVAKATAEDPNLNAETDRLWRNAANNRIHASIEYCQMVKGQLFNMSPVAVYQMEKPTP